MMGRAKTIPKMIPRYNIFSDLVVPYCFGIGDLFSGYTSRPFIDKN